MGYLCHIITSIKQGLFLMHSFKESTSAKRKFFFVHIEVTLIHHQANLLNIGSNFHMILIVSDRAWTMIVYRYNVCIGYFTSVLCIVIV